MISKVRYKTQLKLKRYLIYFLSCIINFAALLWRKKAVMNLNIGEASPVKAVQQELQSVELGSVNSVLSLLCIAWRVAATLAAA